MMRKISNSLISMLLVLTVFVTSFPLATWTAIASTIESEQVDSDATITPLTSESDITVDYPTSVDDYVYIESKEDKSDLTEDQITECDYMVKIGVFDPVLYIQIYPDLKDAFCSTVEGNQVICPTYVLYSHFLRSGIYEGRCASPFFCIRCYRDEHSDLIDACPTYMDAWNHFKGRLDEKDGHTLSPVVNPQYYKKSDLVFKDYTTRALLEQMSVAGGVFNGNDLRCTSDRFDNIAYFYNNSSLFHTENGVQKCYRKYMLEITKLDDTISSGCKLHHGKNYYGLAELDESFSGTLTNIGVNKNLAINSDGTAPQVVAPSNTKNELWLFTKQSDGTYTIEIAPTNNNLTYEGTTETRKYLVANHDDNSVRVSDTPMKWSIYEVDGLYVLRAHAHDRYVLNITDDGEINISIFNNSATESTAYNENSLNQMFIINTTYDTLADSDGLGVDFYASIDAFLDNGWDTKVALTSGDMYLRTRQLAQGGFPAADQVWRFMKQSDGTYRIVNTANSLYLDSSPTAEIVGSGSGYAMNTKEYENSDYQKWIVRKRDNGGYFIMPVSNISDFYEGSYLSVYTGHQVANRLLYFDRFTGEKVTVFDINTTSKHPYVYDLSGTGDRTNAVSFYAYISSAKSEYKDWYLDNSATEYGVEKKLNDCAGTDIKKHDYYWKFLRNGDGSYSIFSTTTVDGLLGHCNNKIGINEYILDEVAFQNNSWYIFKYAGGYRLQQKMTGQYLCMDENGNLSLTPINTNNYDDFQLFNIQETDMSIDTSAETFKINLFNYGSLINGPYDSELVLDFTNNNNNGLDRRNVELGAGTVIVPEMSKVLVGNYPYVKKYAISAAQPDGSITAANEYTYNTPVQPNMTPNVFKSGSLQYLFDPDSGFVSGGGSMTEYDPTAENGYDYQSQSFKVLNPSGLFQKDEDGYYYYDSKDNSAHLDIDYSNKSSKGTLSGTFKVYDYLTHPVGVRPYGNIHHQGMFMPFNLSHNQGVLSYDEGTNVSGKINYKQSVSGYPDIDKASYTLPAITRNQDNTEESGDRTKSMDYWFGMSLETDFYQTKDGKLNGNDVTFEFSGDDDVWVYLDGILVLDLGCNPNVEKSVINFADSTVDVPEKTEFINQFDNNRQVIFNDGSIGMAWKGYGTTTTCPTYKMSLYEAYYDAYEEVTDSSQKAKIERLIRRSFAIAENKALPQPVSVDADPKYADFEHHNLKFFYLERGSEASNCSIKLNTLSGGATVSKEVTGLNEDIMNTTEYKFKAVSVDENGVETPIANSPYTLSSTFANFSNDGIATVSDLATDENGCFTLKANQKATFGQIPPGSEFKVYELTEDSSVTTSWKTYVYDSTSSTMVETNGTGNVTDTLTVPTDSTIDLVFTNDYEPSQNITITKAFDETDTSENHKPDKNQIYVIGYQILNKEDKVVVTNSVTLHNGESAQILDIPVGYKYRVWEYTPDGTLNFEAPQFSVNNGTVTTKAFVPQGATPGVNSYIEGTAKANSDDKIVVKNKLIKLGNITVTFKYYDRKRTSNGGPAQINDYYSTFTKVLTPEEWEPYLNGATQRINFSKLIAAQGILFNEEVAIDNLIDDYVIWTSQAEAIGENGLKKQKNFFVGKNDDGTYCTYGDIYSENPEMLSYHTNAFGEICDCGEKWVTYYKGSNIIDPETQGNDTEVTAINVWLFNRPKIYKLNLNRVVAGEPTSMTESGDLLIGNDTVTYEAMYNQRVSSAPNEDNDESDINNSKLFWDTYKINESDIVKGKDLNGKDVECIELPETVVDENSSEPYEFMYWSYDASGKFIASTDMEYAYRITTDMTLYAVYGKSDIETPGLTVYRNDIDSYIDESGTSKVRLNTMMNPYNCPDNDSTITETAVMYVMLHGHGEYKNYTETQLIKELSKQYDDSMTYLDKLRQDINSILTTSSKVSGKTLFVDVNITTSGFKYQVESADKNTSKLNLSNKNRFQFTTQFTKSNLDGKHLLAFAAMKKSDEWIVSDNYVDYNFMSQVTR